jgi:hypothetical protein
VEKNKAPLALLRKNTHKTSACLLIFACLLSLCLATQTPASATLSYEDNAKSMLHNLLGLDVSDNNIDAINQGNFPDTDGRFQGLSNQEVQIKLVSGLSASVDFINDTIYEIYLDQRTYPSPTPSASQVTAKAKDFLGKLQAYTQNSFFGELNSMLDNVTAENDTTVTVGNVQLKVSNSQGVFIDYIWTYIDENGMTAPKMNIGLHYEKGQFVFFWGSWQFYTIATKPKIVSQDQAIAAALHELRNYSYTLNDGEVASKFKVATSEDAVSASGFYAYSNYAEVGIVRDSNRLMLYPF